MKKQLLLIFLFTNIISLGLASDWKVVAQLEEGSVFNIVCYDSLNCYALHKKSLGPEIYKTTDAGKSWNMIYTSNFLEEGPPYLINADRLYLSDSNNLYISYSDNSAIFKQSTDGGKTFTKNKISEITFLGWLDNFCMLNNKNGVILGELSKMGRNNLSEIVIEKFKLLSLNIIFV